MLIGGGNPHSYGRKIMKVKQQKRRSKVVRGRRGALQPVWAKAAIIAYRPSDSLAGGVASDFFGLGKGDIYIIGWSRHTRDLFSEMRKAVASCTLKEVEHLAYKPAVDRDGNLKTDENMNDWRPQDEHRESRSKGACFYLQNDEKCWNGWRVEKMPLSHKIYQAKITLTIKIPGHYRVGVAKKVKKK